MDDAQRILVVDDEPGPREALRVILDPRYQVVTATDGPEALQVIHTTPPDLIFLDIWMPGMDGIEVLKAVKEVDSRIEAIIMTGHASLETVRGAMAYGASEYLIKPFSEDEVDGAVKKALARRAERMGEHRQVRTLLEHLRGLAHASTAATASQEVLQRASVVLEQIKQLVSATVALLHVIEEPGQRLTWRISLGASREAPLPSDMETWSPLLSQALERRLPLILMSPYGDRILEGMARPLTTLGYQGGAFFPLLAGAEAVGVLSFLYKVPIVFRSEWIDIGQAVAELLAVAIHLHQRYHSSTQDALQHAQHATQLRILQEISRAVVGTLDLSETLRAIGDQLQTGLGFVGFHVWLSEENGAQWRKAYGNGPDAGWQPGDADRPPPQELQVDGSTDAHVVLGPIVQQETTIGLVKLVREPQQEPIAEVEVELISMLLEYIGLAVKNSLLYEEIKETKSYLENLINGAGDAIITVNQEDVVTAWNQSAERIFHYRAEEVLRQHIRTLFPAALYEPWRDAVLRQGSTKCVETQLKRRDGTPVHVSLTLSPLLNSRDEITGFSAILRDVTEDRQLREQLAQSEKLSALGEMAAGIAHNLNNILAAIMGRAQLLLHGSADTETLQRGVATIQRAVEDGAAMVQRIQRFARGGIGSEFKLTDLNQLMQETVEATQLIWKDQLPQEGRSIEVSMELGSLPPVRCRPAELREVLINLILNAVDAMPAGGRLSLRTIARGEVACIEIADTGTGMTEEVKRRAFNPFFTTKGAKGTGLGLSISHALIKGQDGEIELQSELGKGTTFVITLPMGIQR